MDRIESSSSSSSTGSKLRTHLIAAQEPSRFDLDQYFVPKGKQRIGLEDITAELTSHGFDPREEIFKQIVEFVYHDATRVFLTLVYSRMTRRIREFFDDSFDDRKLPIEYEIATWRKHNPLALNDPEPLPGIFFTLGNGHYDRSKVFQSWDSTDIREFCDNQWRFNAPSFPPDNYGGIWLQYQKLKGFNYLFLLPMRTILPFDIEGTSKGTAFSKIWKIKVHSDHRGDLNIPVCKSTFQASA